LKGLDRSAVIPKSGDVAISALDVSLSVANSFSASILVLDSAVKGGKSFICGYSPIAFVRSGHAACRLVSISWKIGKSTAGKKLSNPHLLVSGEMAMALFFPLLHLVVEDASCAEGLSRVAFLEGSDAVFIGRVISLGLLLFCFLLREVCLLISLRFHLSLVLVRVMRVVLILELVLDLLHLSVRIGFSVLLGVKSSSVYWLRICLLLSDSTIPFSSVNARFSG
jgi:hypothetical protein